MRVMCLLPKFLTKMSHVDGLNYVIPWVTLLRFPNRFYKLHNHQVSTTDSANTGRQNRQDRGGEKTEKNEV